MIYAIPCDNEKVANHFMKAPQFAIFDGHKCLTKMDNPAADSQSSCQDKSTTLELLETMQAEAVLVKNIGERALGKLLAKGIRVFKLTQAATINNATQEPSIELHTLEQANPSIQHQKKHADSNGKTSCCSSEKSSHAKQDCSHHQHGGQQRKKRCCQQ